MNVPDFKAFRIGCQVQDVALHDALHSPDPQLNGTYSCYAPSEMLAAVATAGAILNTSRSVELADRPIDLGAMGERLSSSQLAQILTNIINASLGSSPPIESDLNFMTSEQFFGIHACASAESKFMNLIGRLKRQDTGCQIIGNDEPLLLRKGAGEGEPSALSLGRININGIPYPAGSVFWADLDGRICRTAPESVELFDPDHITGLTFMRLSMIALEGKEREVNFREILSRNSPTSMVLRRARLSQIKKVVGKVYSHKISTKSSP